MIGHADDSETRAAIAASVESLLSQHYSFEARQHALAACDASLPGFWFRLAEMGLFGIELPAEAGGIDATFGEVALVVQAFGRFLVVEPFVPTAVIAVGLITALGDQHQQRALLARIVGGQSKVALVHNPGLIRVEPESTGWRVSGHCESVSGGDTADMLLVAADGEAGCSVFALPASHAGMKIARYRRYDGHGAAEIMIDAVAGTTALLGAPGSAGPALSLAQDRGAAAMVHEAVGAMETLCRLTFDYLKTRVQFGQPLANFQVLQHKMVDMWLEVEQARSMALLATAAVAEPDVTTRGVDISCAKTFIGRAAKFVGETAVQLHGAIALTADYPGGHYFKRLTMIRAEFGDELYHLERIARLSQ